MEKHKILAVDFDGTLFTRDSNYDPLSVGKPIRKNIKLVKEYKASGYKLILWTCRNNESLDLAIEACKERGIIFDAINENLPEIKEKEDKMFGKESRKIYATYYLDDKNVYI